MEEVKAPVLPGRFVNRVGFWYQAYSRPLAVQNVLERVRAHYPTEPIHLCSDGGLWFDSEAREYRCEYEHYSERIWGDMTTGGCADYDPERHYWRQMARFVPVLDWDVDWIVILEDDVRCLGRATRFPSTECAGPVGNEWSLPFQELTYLGAWYGNCGGSIVSRPALKEALGAMSLPKAEMAHAADNRFGEWLDASITGTMQLNGCRYEVWAEHAEISRGILGNNPAFDHQWKVWY